MNIRPHIVSPEVVAKLRSTSFRYTRMVDVIHSLWIRSDSFGGVAGDGANGAYEWFYLSPGLFAVSDCGYGDSAVALRDLLNKYVT